MVYPQFNSSYACQKPAHPITGILTCLPWPASAGLASVWRGDAPPIPLGLRRPMRPAGSPRGVIWNCLCPRRATPPLTEPAVGRELDP